jgi:hypothetical protein
MSELKISQSMMKSYVDYLTKKECGLLFKAKYIDKTVDSIPSAAMKQGIYFEYLATNALPRNNIVPEPELTSKGTLSSDYIRIKQAAEFFKQIIRHYKIKIHKVGYVLSTNDMTGIIDIWAEWDNQFCIIDLKYTGFIDNKWDDLGWDTDSLPMKDSLMIQGLHYKLLVKEALGLDDVPFYYFIFNSKDPTDMKIIKQVVDPDKFDSHKQNVIKVKNKLADTYYRALPAYRKCKDCPLKETCKEKYEFPEVTEVYY